MQGSGILRVKIVALGKSEQKFLERYLENVQILSYNVKYSGIGKIRENTYRCMTPVEKQKGKIRQGRQKGKFL